jgi:hypothetical protein
MSGDLTDFYVHQVTVETFEGTGASGPVYAAPATVQCYLDSSTKLIRAGDGEQVVSSSRVYCSVADAWRFTPDSRVTQPAPAIYPSDAVFPESALWPPADRAAQVITTNQLDAPGLGLPEHTVVYLT